MAFLQDALKEGYSYGQIADFLGEKLGKPASMARDAGYSDKEIAEYLAAQQEQADWDALPPDRSEGYGDAPGIGGADTVPEKTSDEEVSGWGLLRRAVADPALSVAKTVVQTGRVPVGGYKLAGWVGDKLDTTERDEKILDQIGDKLGIDGKTLGLIGAMHGIDTSSLPVKRYLATLMNPGPALLRLPRNILDWAGYDAEGALEVLNELQSPELQANRQETDQTKGFGNRAKALLSHPDVVLDKSIESIGPMLLGGPISKGIIGAGEGILAVAGKESLPWLARALESGTARVAAGAASEGVVQTGQKLEEYSQDGLTGKKVLAAFGSGAVDSALALVGGKLAHRFGFADAQNWLAGLKTKAARDGGEKAAAAIASNEFHVISRIIMGGVSEGVFEELPQSAQEQIWENAAKGRPLFEGVEEVGAEGLVLGTVIGGGTNIITGHRGQKTDTHLPDASILAAGSVDEAIAQADSNLSGKQTDTNNRSQITGVRGQGTGDKNLSPETWRLSPDSLFAQAPEETQVALFQAALNYDLDPNLLARLPSAASPDTIGNIDAEARQMSRLLDRYDGDAEKALAAIPKTEDGGQRTDGNAEEKTTIPGTEEYAAAAAPGQADDTAGNQPDVRGENAYALLAPAAAEAEGRRPAAAEDAVARDGETRPEEVFGARRATGREPAQVEARDVGVGTAQNTEGRGEKTEGSEALGAGNDELSAAVNSLKTEAVAAIEANPALKAQAENQAGTVQQYVDDVYATLPAAAMRVAPNDPAGYVRRIKFAARDESGLRDAARTEEGPRNLATITFGKDEITTGKGENTTAGDVPPSPAGGRVQVFEQAMASQPPKGWVHDSGGGQARRFIAGKNQAEAVFWTDIQGKLANDAPELARYSHSLDKSALNHIRKNHGDAQKEATRGQIAISNQDLERIPEIVADYDAIRTDLVGDQGQQEIAFAKRYKDGVIVYIAGATTKRQNLRAVSMWKYPATRSISGLLDSILEVEPGKRKPRNQSGVSGDALSPFSGYQPDALAPSLDSKVTSTDGKGNTYEQRRQSRARGQVEVRGQGTNREYVISLFDGADLSTLLHETGHIYLEELEASVLDGTASDSVKADYLTLRRWLGKLNEDPGTPLSRAQREKFARGFEAYLREGKAPSKSLARVFSNFKEWLTAIYQDAKQLRVRLNDDVRAVFDRLVAREQETGNRGQETGDGSQVYGQEETAMRERVAEWLSPENLDRAQGKTREEIFAEFGNDLQAIAFVPKQYLQYFTGTTNDNRLYSGKGYFIDHAVNHHPEIDAGEYGNIQDILNTPDEVIIDRREHKHESAEPNRDNLIFVKRIDKNYLLTVALDKGEDGKIVLHKSLYRTKNKKLYPSLPRVEIAASGGGVSPISHTESSAPGGSLSVRDAAPETVSRFLRQVNRSELRRVLTARKHRPDVVRGQETGNREQEIERDGMRINPETGEIIGGQNDTDQSASALGPDATAQVETGKTQGERATQPGELPKSKQSPRQRAANDPGYNQDAGTIAFNFSKKKDIKAFTPAFATAEYTLTKDPAGQRMLAAAEQRADDKISLENRIIDGINDSANLAEYTAKHNGFIKTFKELKQAGEKGYAKVRDYLLECDREGQGFTIKYNKGDKYKREAPSWQVLDPKGKDVGKPLASEQEAVARMIAEEGKRLKHAGYSDQEVAAVATFRGMTNRAFDQMVADWKALEAKYEELGLDPPTFDTVDETRRWAILDKKGKVMATFGTREKAELAMEIAATANMKAKPKFQAIKRQDDNAIRRPMRLQDAIAQMSDLRGTYFPRQRDRGRVVLRATHESGDQILEKGDAFLMPSEAGQSVSNWLMDKANAVTPLGRRAKELAAKGYAVTMEREARTPESVFDAAGLMASVSSIMDESLASMEKGATSDAQKEALRHVHMEILERAADVFRSRGFLSSRMKRTESYWRGFETDPLKAGIQYAQGLSAGIAKRQTAEKLTMALTGRDIGWKAWKEANPDGSWEDYGAFVEARKISPTEQPNLYGEAKSWMQEILRNEEASDRAIGVLKGLATLKYMGFRVSSAAINLTNMVQAVPATIASHTGRDLNQAMRQVSRSLFALAQFKAGKASDLDKKIFFDIRARGWDRSQFNHEAAGVLRSRAGRVWQGFVDSSMWLFGKAEEINRASTIHAAYREWQKAFPKMSHGELMQKAKQASDRAHGWYGKETAPRWTRGANNPMKLIWTFQKFSQNYMLNIGEMAGKGDFKNVTWMLLSPAILGGLGASPLIAGLLKAFGAASDRDPEEELYAWAERMFGSDAFLRAGLPGMLGVSFKGSLSMSVPFADVFGASSGTDALFAMAGAPGSVIKDVLAAGGHATRGEWSKAGEDLLPTAFGNVLKGYREATEGITTEKYGTVWWGDKPLKATATEGYLRAAGFNPERISSARERQWHEKRVAARFTDRRTEINSRIKHVIKQYEGQIPDEERGKLMAEINRYNEDVRALADPEVRPITGRSIQSMIKRDKPGKRELRRAAGWQDTGDEEERTDENETEE